ncbi:hypothetical protein [Streptomyces virginiae]|uniref:hypothetical protein n=1 Tax=Streptomyces virginiae TaxID=1961 RepID=UPI0034226A06
MLKRIMAICAAAVVGVMPLAGQSWAAPGETTAPNGQLIARWVSEKPMVTKAVAPGWTRLASASATTDCWTVDHPVRALSFLGTTIYVYHQKLSWCEDGSRITNIYDRFDYISEKSSVAFPSDNRAVDMQFASGNGSASQMSRRIDLCVVNGGCYASNLPWSKITVYPEAGRSPRYQLEGNAIS